MEGYRQETIQHEICILEYLILLTDIQSLLILEVQVRTNATVLIRHIAYFHHTAGTHRFSGTDFLPFRRTVAIIIGAFVDILSEAIIRFYQFLTKGTVGRL